MTETPITSAPSSTPTAVSGEDTAPIPHISLRPQKGWVSINLRELWQYRELLWMLAMRDIRVRYKQTAIGAAWFILSPLITAVIFTIVFGGLARIPSDGIPYGVFAFSGVLLFNLFSRCADAGAQSLVANRHLISKVYFPRLIYPLAPIIGTLLDFLVGATMLVLLMVYYHVLPQWTAVMAPLFVLEAAMLGFGIGLWLGAVNVRYRDVGIAIPFLLQVCMYASPVVYPISLAQKQWPRGYWLFVANPMSGILEGFRWAVIGNEHPPLLPILLSPLLIGLLVITGLFYFRRMEKFFADLV